MKLWHLITLSVVLLTLSGCGGAKPTPKDKIVIDSSLPSVELTKNGVIADMNSIAFEWKSISNPKVQGIYVYKRSPNTQKEAKLEYYKTIESRFKTHFFDTEVVPDMRYAYSFVTFSKDAQSPMGKIITVNALPVLQSVSWIHSITGMPRTAKIIWRPHVNQKVQEYIVERKTLEDKEWKTYDTIKGRLNAEYIDGDLKDNYVYMYRLRVKTFDGITSTPSQSVKVLTKALPKSVNNIKATINLPRVIKLQWDATEQKDFSLYYVYRSESVDGDYDLVATLHNNSYENKVEEDGKIYFYRVSVVDKDSLESIYDQNSIEGMTLVKPEAPVITQLRLENSHINIVWKKTDDRTQAYSLTRAHKKGWFDKNVKIINNLHNTQYIDRDITVDSTYTYFVQSVDKFGIKSKASISVKLVIPESKSIIKAEQKATIKEVSVRKQQESKEVITDSGNLDLSGL